MGANENCAPKSVSWHEAVYTWGRTGEKRIAPPKTFHDTKAGYATFHDTKAGYALGAQNKKFSPQELTSCSNAGRSTWPPWRKANSSAYLLRKVDHQTAPGTPS